MPSPRRSSLQPSFSLSLGEDKRIVIDQTDAILLRRVSETGSLTEAAKLVGISYRNAWDRIKGVEKSLGAKVLETKVGGADGGGAVLTRDGVQLLRDFRRVRKYLFEVLDEQEFMAHASYKLSARNRLRVKIEKVDKGEVISLVKMKIVGPASLTSIISTEAVQDLDLKAGDEAVAIVKSTEVILAKNSPGLEPARPAQTDADL